MAKEANVLPLTKLPDSDEMKLQLLSLAKLKLMIEAEKMNGSGGLVLTALRDGYASKEAETFQGLLESRKIQTRDQFNSLLKDAIRVVQPLDDEAQRNLADLRKEEQDQAADLNLELNSKSRQAEFHQLMVGEFDFRIKDKSWHKSDRVKYPFELSDIPLTQMAWARLQVAMGETDPDKINPSHFKSGKQSIEATIQGISVQMQPDHPIENVSYPDIENFVAGLNRLSHFGNRKTQTILEGIFAGHKKGDEYNLPTYHQIRYAMNLRGKVIRENGNTSEETELLKSAWYWGNSNRQTQAVASLPPRMIDTDDKGTIRAFYDLDGNVFVWTKGGEFALNERGRKLFPGRKIKNHPFQGSSYATDVPEVLKADGQIYARQDNKTYLHQNPQVGIRLTRTTSNSKIGLLVRQAGLIAEDWIKQMKSN